MHLTNLREIVGRLLRAGCRDVGKSEAAAKLDTIRTTSRVGERGNHRGDSPVSAASLGELVRMIDEERSAESRQGSPGRMFKTGKDPAAIVSEKGMVQLSERERLTN